MTDPRAELFQVHCGPVERLVMNELVLAYDKKDPLRPKDIAKAIYSEDPDGGPENAFLCIRMFIGRIRKKIEPLGWTITKNEYRLRRIADERH